MAIFVDFEEEDVEPPQDGQPPQWRETVTVTEAPAHAAENETDEQREETSKSVVRGDANKTSATKALGCYP